MQDINYVRGWRKVWWDNKGFYVRLFGGRWYNSKLEPWLGKRIFVDSYGWDSVQCWVVKFQLFICQIDEDL